MCQNVVMVGARRPLFKGLREDGGGGGFCGSAKKEGRFFLLFPVPMLVSVCAWWCRHMDLFNGECAFVT